MLYKEIELRKIKKEASAVYNRVSPTLSLTPFKQERRLRRGRKWRTNIRKVVTFFLFVKACDRSL